MIVNRYYKYRIYPSKQQKILMTRMFGDIRFVANKSIERVRAAIDTAGYSYDYCSESRNLKNLKSELSFLKDAESTSLQQALRHIGSAVKRYKGPMHSASRDFCQEEIANDDYMQ
jgi:putative transposase